MPNISPSGSAASAHLAWPGRGRGPGRGLRRHRADQRQNHAQPGVGRQPGGFPHPPLLPPVGAGLHRRPQHAPWQPSWSVDKRFTTAQTTGLVNNYVTALDMRRQAHEAGAIFAGRMRTPRLHSRRHHYHPHCGGDHQVQELPESDHPVYPEHLYSRCPGSGFGLFRL